MISTLSRLGLHDLQSVTYCLHLAKNSKFLGQPCCYLWFFRNTAHESYRYNLFLNRKLSIARTLYSRANNIISDENKKIQEFHHVSDILKFNNFPSHKRSFSFKTNPVASQQSNQQFQGFATIPYVQGISEPIKRMLAAVGIRVAMKSHFTLSSIFRKPKDPIDFEEK